MRGAIAHEWIEASGGAERVLDSLVEAFPNVDIYALWDDAPARYPNNAIYESWLARTPLRHHKALAVPYLPQAWRGLRPHGNYEWLLASSHLFAHHARFGDGLGDIPKFVYAHTPARYIWSPELDARGDGLAVRGMAHLLRPLDRRRAQESVAIAANSEFVRDRIQRSWGRDATVIYPPVDVERIQSVPVWRELLSESEIMQLESLPSEFILGASRFIPYKRLELVIEAANQARLPVVIAGRGPGEARLRALAATANVPVSFVISPSDPMLYSLYQAALVFIFPVVEDFGIMPVEAMAAGCPVVTVNVGGASESLTAGVSGEIVAELSPRVLGDAAIRASAFRASEVASSVIHFRKERFLRQIRAWISTGGERTL